MRQWERMQSNPYMYNKEILPCTDDQELEALQRIQNAALSPSALRVATTFHPEATERRTLQIAFHRNIRENLAVFRNTKSFILIRFGDRMHSSFRHCKKIVSFQSKTNLFLAGGSKDKSWRETVVKQIELMSKEAQESFHMRERQLELDAKKKGLFQAEIQLVGGELQRQITRKKIAILKTEYYEPLDLLLAGYEDGRIRK